MSKIAKQYLDIDPWIIRETEFNPDRSKVSESIFALANEFSGSRGYFEEGYSADSMPGNYFNGIYEKGEHQYSTEFKGFAKNWTYMVNAVDWLYVRIEVDGEILDLAKVDFSDFVRSVDMRRGILERSFVWKTQSGKELRLKFERFLSMVNSGLGAQRLSFEALNFDGKVNLVTGLDFGTLYHLRETRPWALTRHDQKDGWTSALGTTESSGHRIFSSFGLSGDGVNDTVPFTEGRLTGQKLVLNLEKQKTATFEKVVVHHTEKDASKNDGEVWETGMAAVTEHRSLSYADAEKAHVDHWADIWLRMDIEIEGDDENQQGFRYCVFHMHQTYHGEDSRLNIGAKGLTGEHYWGVTWWDTETYCLPFYLFNNMKAARNLIDYRYKTLPGAKARAHDFNLPGARYPMCTIDGEETCDVWQHGDLEIHVSAAVAYGIWKYHHISHDDEFLFEKGAEMLLEIARFYASRGGWGQKTNLYGFWGVMGPDEMHTMVNNNAYTNHMAGKSFTWAIETLTRMEKELPESFLALSQKTGLQPDELADWQHKADTMETMLDEATGLYEQHEGYYNMPHIDYGSIPDEQFPVQKKWPYVDLFRYDLTKQPDVLQFFFLFGSSFNQESLRKNFDYYEPRCSHESSLSPAIHSILASRLGEDAKAFEYASYASRLDLDDYNNNTNEGLHITSMAGAWMNLVYGFAGLQSDGPLLSFTPACPEKWKSFTFRLTVNETDLLTVCTTHGNATFTMSAGASTTIMVCGETIKVTDRGVSVSLHKPEAAQTIQAVLFDLDGVIVSTDEYHYQAWKRLAEEKGISFTREDNDRCRGVSRMESLDIVLEKSSKEYTPSEKEEMAGKKNDYYLILLQEITPADILPGVEEFMADLKDRGVRVAIGSSSRNAPAILRLIGMDDQFDTIVDGNGITHSKPDPEVFLKAAARLEIPAQNCLVVEDADAGVESALAAKMRCLAVGSAMVHPGAHQCAEGLDQISLESLESQGMPFVR